MSSLWEGNLVRLRAVEPQDWELYWQWNQDESIAKNNSEVYFPQSQAAAKRWTEATSVRAPVSDAFTFIIENFSQQSVGNLVTHNCDPSNGTLRYGLAIGKEHRRNGYAKDALTLLFRYFFLERHYRKALVHIYSYNTPSILLHKKIGFQEEGKLRSMVFSQGKYHDELIFGLLLSEYKQSMLYDCSEGEND